jgi:hypothetical protein
MSDRLEAALRELAADIAYPPTPDVRAALSMRLATPVRDRWWPGPLPRAVVLAAVTTLLLAAVAAALVLALPGLRITITPELPTPTLGTRLALGEPAAADTLSTRATFTVHLPRTLGTPDEAYVAADGRVVTLLYAADRSLPEIGGTGIGLLLQQFDGTLDSGQVEKLVPEVGATVAPVEVAGEPGFWIEGHPHVVRFIDPSGAEGMAPSRLAGDTLVWERGGILYRIESELGRAATIQVAETIGR